MTFKIDKNKPMKFMLRLKTYTLSFYFYKQFVLISTVIVFMQYLSLNALNIDSTLYSIVIGKVFLLGLVYLYYYRAQLNQTLVFYKNFGISKPHLFLNTFLFDILLTIIIVNILDLF